MHIRGSLGESMTTYSMGSWACSARDKTWRFPGMHSERLRTMSSQLYLEEKPDNQHCVEGHSRAWGRWQMERRAVAWYQAGERMAMFQPAYKGGWTRNMCDRRACLGRRLLVTCSRNHAKRRGYSRIKKEKIPLQWEVKRVCVRDEMWRCLMSNSLLRGLRHTRRS